VTVASGRVSAWLQREFPLSRRSSKLEFSGSVEEVLHTFPDFEVSVPRMSGFQGSGPPQKDSIMSPTPPSTTSSSAGGQSPDAQYRVVKKRNRVPLSCAPCRHRK
jgi:hypothetical protein